MEPLRLIFDMETTDPDDVLTLCLIATHPAVDLRAVTVFPGGNDQVGVVRHVLGRLGRQNVPVGAGQPKKPAARVSEFHYRCRTVVKTKELQIDVEWGADKGPILVLIQRPETSTEAQWFDDHSVAGMQEAFGCVRAAMARRLS